MTRVGIVTSIGSCMAEAATPVPALILGEVFCPAVPRTNSTMALNSFWVRPFDSRGPVASEVQLEIETTHATKAVRRLLRMGTFGTIRSHGIGRVARLPNFT